VHFVEVFVYLLYTVFCTYNKYLLIYREDMPVVVLCCAFNLLAYSSANRKKSLILRNCIASAMVVVLLFCFYS